MATIASLNLMLTASTAPLAKALNAGKSMVSGFAEHTNAIGQTIKGLLGPLTSPLALIGEGLGAAAAIAAADRYQQSMKKLDAVLQATGNTTGISRSQLVGMAEDLQKVTNFSERTTLGAEAMLATFHHISGDTFKSALHAAMDLTSVMGGDLQGNIVKVGRALDNPIAGMKALSRLGVTFSEQQKKSIAEMTARGDLGGAQQMILNQMQGKFGGAAEAMADPFVQFKNKLESLAESIGGILRPVAVGAIKIFGPIVDGISGTLKPLIPIVENVMSFLTGLWNSEIQFLGTVIGPAWNEFVGFLGTAFNGFLDFLESALPTAVEILSQVFTTGLAFAEAFWDGMTTIFTSMANTIGLSSSTSATSISTLGNVFNEVFGTISAVLLVLEFGFTHWQDLAALALVSVEFSVVRLGNQIEYFFGTMIPAYLGWFGDNWGNIFQDAANIVATAAGNIWKNIQNLWDAIVGLFEGNGFDFKAVGLLDGFKSALTQMPQIAARVAGGTETALGREMTTISDNLNKNFSSFIDERTKQQAEATQKLHDATHGLFDKLRHPNFPTMPKLALPGATLPGNQLLAGSGGDAKVGALVKGSEEAYKASHSRSDTMADMLDINKQQLSVQKDILKQQGGGDDDDDGSSTASIPG